jgi:hypothetical protein
MILSGSNDRAILSERAQKCKRKMTTVWTTCKRYFPASPQQNLGTDEGFQVFSSPPRPDTPDTPVTDRHYKL